MRSVHKISLRLNIDIDNLFYLDNTPSYGNGGRSS